MGGSRIKSTLINTAMGFIVRIVNILMSFVLRTVFIYTLGIEYIGVSSLFTDILTVLSLAELGIGSAITYALYKPIAANDNKKIAAIMHFFKRAYRFIALIVLLIGCAIIPFLDSLVNNVPNIRESIILIYVLFLINSVVSYLVAYKSTLLVACQKSYKISTVETMSTLVKTILQTISLFCFNNYIVFLIVAIIAEVAKNIIVSNRADKEFFEVWAYKDKRLSKNETKGLFKDIKALAMYKVSDIILNGTDSIIISTMIGTNIVGAISNYKLLFNSIYTIVNQFFTSAQPSIGNLAVESDENRQFSIFNVMNFFSFWITCYATTSFIVLCEAFIKIWLGENCKMGLPIVIVLTINFYLMMMIRPVSAFRISNGIFVRGQYRPVIMAMMNLIMSVILTLKIGVIGVLLGTIIARLITQVWYDPILVYRDIFKKNPLTYFKTYLIYVFITFMSSCISWWIADNIDFGGIFSLLIQAFICFVISNFLVVIFCHRSKVFKDTISLIRKFVKSRLRK